MKDIIKKYPPKKEKKNREYSHPSFSMDLHGFTEQESLKKLLWLEEYISFHKHETIQIITGIGSGILRNLVIKKLKNWEQKNIITQWKEKKNDEYIQNIKEKRTHNPEKKKNDKKRETGVFLFII